MATKKKEFVVDGEVFPGMFCVEREVHVVGADGKVHGGLFPECVVREGGMKVTVIQREKDRILVEVIEGGGYGFLSDGSRIWVKPESLHLSK